MSGTASLETSLHPSPEQEAIIAARHADPNGSLRVVAFAGSGKTTALRLLALADSTPALYITHNNTGLSNSRRMGVALALSPDQGRSIRRDFHRPV